MSTTVHQPQIHILADISIHKISSFFFSVTSSTDGRNVIQRSRNYSYHTHCPVWGHQCYFEAVWPHWRTRTLTEAEAKKVVVVATTVVADWKFEDIVSELVEIVVDPGFQISLKLE